MKRFSLIILCVAALFSLTSCEYLDELLQLADEFGQNVVDAYVDKWSNLVNETPYEAVVDGNKLTYGSHTYEIVKELDVNTTEFSRATASVTFSNIPSGFTEFKAVYEKLFGQSVAGTAAMIPMAMEIFARDRETGKKCLELLCTEGTAGDMTTELKRKVSPSTNAEAQDPYIQRYLPGALLKGATPSNAYAPTSPFTVEMTMTSNGVKESAQIGGKAIYMCIVTYGGWGSAQRGVDLFQATGSTSYKVYGCPGCYAQCQTISGTWQGLK